jgi:hypothetical protein
LTHLKFVRDLRRKTTKIAQFSVFLDVTLFIKGSLEIACLSEMNISEPEISMHCKYYSSLDPSRIIKSVLGSTLLREGATLAD